MVLGGSEPVSKIKRVTQMGGLYNMYVYIESTRVEVNKQDSATQKLDNGQEHLMMGPKPV